MRRHYYYCSFLSFLKQLRKLSQERWSPPEKPGVLALWLLLVTPPLRSSWWGLGVRGRKEDRFVLRPQGATGVSWGRSVMEVVLRKVNLHGDQVSKALKCAAFHLEILFGLRCLLSLFWRTPWPQGKFWARGATQVCTRWPRLYHMRLWVSLSVTLSPQGKCQGHLAGKSGASVTDRWICPRWVKGCSSHSKRL